MDVAFLILSVLLFAFSTFIGFTLGTAAGERAVTAADYWKMNAAAIVVAVLLAAVLASLPLLYSVIIGLLAGSIVGMKMAFGESTGPWKAHDRVFNVNRAHREAAERGDGEARRARRRSGEKAPDLMSVEGTGSPAGDGKRNERGARGAAAKRNVR